MGRFLGGVGGVGWAVRIPVVGKMGDVGLIGGEVWGERAKRRVAPQA
jgi:hypothetical protein